MGVTYRSGTHFLQSLLAKHPIARVREPIWEDFFLAHSGHLFSFAQELSRSWNENGSGVPAEERARLLRSLGDGLVGFLNAGDSAKRVVTKVPSVKGLTGFFELFPSAYLLLLIRDGRSVVESSVRSFGSTRSSVTRKWAKGAQEMLSFVQGEPDGRWRLVRYEDLLTHFDEELEAILRFCQLDPTKYDFEAARRLPLAGSSTERGGGEEVHWRPVERPPTFNGLERHAGWSEEQHREFNAEAGHLLAAFGYEANA
jgi:Sulfotransferase family